MDLHLAGKTVVVTGASKGIGLAITRALAAEGASVVAGALNGSSELDELASSSRRTAGLGRPDDAGRPGRARRRRADRVGRHRRPGQQRRRRTPRLDGFVGAHRRRLGLDADHQLPRRGPHHARRDPAHGRAGREPTSSRSARSTPSCPTPVSSTTAPPRARSPTSASRCRRSSAPASGSTRSAPGRCAPTSGSASGGVAATVGGASDTDPDEVVRRQEAQAPTGRFTYPSEVADLALYLASDRAGNVTGSDVLIDGGLIATL